MHKQPLIALATTSALFLASTAAAGVDHILIFDFGGEGEEAAFRDLLAGQNHIADGGWDFDRDPDYGGVAFRGPLTSAGAGPVSPGTIDNDNISMFGPGNVGGGNDLAAIGPSAGFGNPSNAVLANYFTDPLEISFTSEDTTAIEFIALNLLGGDFVEITVTDSAGERFQRLVPAPPSGNGIGIAIDQSLSNETIASIDLFDGDGRDGAEGVMGAGTVYIIPAPGAFALLGIAGLVSRRRRRC